jgi:MYXO-CTERM domain-containing protein
LSAVTVDLGTALQGKTIKVRFRIGADTNSGGPGWFIDNIGFQGITNKPFPAQQADTRTCSGVPIANAGPDQSVPLNAMVSLDGSGSSDPAAGPQPLAFVWDQLAGPAVALAGASTVKTTFTAPATPSILTFRVQVNDGDHGASDTVDIIVGGGGITDGGVDGGNDAGGTGGAGGTDGGRDANGGAAGVRDATTESTDRVDALVSDAAPDVARDGASDARTDARADGTGGAGGSGGTDDGGCSCRIGQPHSNTGSWKLPMLGAVALLAARRRRRR